MAYVFRRPWTDSRRLRTPVQRFIPTVPSVGAQTIIPSPVTIPLIIPTHTISGSGSTSVVPSPVTIPLVIPTHVVGGSGATLIVPSPVAILLVIPTHIVRNVILIVPSPIAISLVIPTHVINGSGAAPVTPSPVTIPLVIPTHVVSGSGVASIVPSSITIPLVIPTHTIGVVTVVLTGSPLTTIITPVTTDYFTVNLQDAFAKIIDELGGKNVYVYDMPPVLNENHLRDLLNVPDDDNAGFRKLEGWFCGRVGFRNATDADQDAAGNTIFQQHHNLRIVVYAWHGDLLESYRYVQNQVDELLGLLHKNLDMSMGSQLDLVHDFQASFGIAPFASHDLYRGTIDFDATRTITLDQARITNPYSSS